MHEYQLTPYSLLAAVSIGLKSEDIVTVLARLSKNVLPAVVERWIRETTSTHGKVKVVLRQGRFFVESSKPAVLQHLLSDEVIAEARVLDSAPEQQQQLKRDAKTGFLVSDELKEKDSIGAALRNDALEAPAPRSLLEVLDEQDVEEEAAERAAKAVAAEEADSGGGAPQQVHAFEVRREKINDVRKQCVLLNCPSLEEYDFRADQVTDVLRADLKPSTSLRAYQERSLSKMFGNGRARSGIIVLPCGAGKTLVGITAACTIKKRVLVLATSQVAVEQWKYQFQLWSDIDPVHISRFTSDNKEQLPACGVTVTTYSMISHAGKRSAEAQAVMDRLATVEWGLLILDEVQVMPAKTFRTVLHRIAARCKLGLTATLVREDDKIQDLNFLVGPKLYEANWMDLQAAGNIAKVACHEVWCDMTPQFYAEYLRAGHQNLRRLLWVMNPNKFRACEFLVKHHEARGDKTIVFSDNIFALLSYARQLQRPFIYGDTSNRERLSVFSHFQHDPAVKTIFISKVGDNSIDLPSANVLIQISSHYASRRQEAQRLGRILRPKPRMDEEYNAFFYSIVSKDTSEMFYSAKRQEFLIEQGYSFRVLTDLVRPDDRSLCLASWDEQKELLARVLADGDRSGALERHGGDDVGNVGAASARRARHAALLGMAPSASRRTGSLAALAGGRARYSEQPRQRHSLFKQRAREVAQDRARLGL